MQQLTTVGKGPAGDVPECRRNLHHLDGLTVGEGFRVDFSQRARKPNVSAPHNASIKPA